MSHIVADAIATWRACREEFELHRWAEYALAEEATNGYLLNERGQRAGIDATSLFMGTTARALAYASEELRRYWEHERPRPTYERFERQWLDSRGDPAW